MTTTRPIVLSLSGHDPSGGAGIQADIEAVVSQNCHCCSIVTALTEQDSRNVHRIIPQRPEDIWAQAQTLLADFPIAAIKIGLLGQIETVEIIHRILQQASSIPMILDPILAAGGGKQLADDELLQAIRELLIPQTALLTPNSVEARRLAQQQDLSACGQTLQALGAQYVLLTGAHEQSSNVDNRLFMPKNRIKSFSFRRLPHSYHGSGCTLASTAAALLAQGHDIVNAVTQAQQYTWNTLQNAYRPGQGQHNPNRLYWHEVH